MEITSTSASLIIDAHHSSAPTNLWTLVMGRALQLADHAMSIASPLHAVMAEIGNREMDVAKMRDTAINELRKHIPEILSVFESTIVDENGNLLPEPPSVRTTKPAKAICFEVDFTGVGTPGDAADILYRYTDFIQETGFERKLADGVKTITFEFLTHSDREDRYPDAKDNLAELVMHVRKHANDIKMFFDGLHETQARNVSATSAPTLKETDPNAPRPAAAVRNPADPHRAVS